MSTPGARQKLESALRCQRAGQVSEAESLCRSVMEEFPADAEAIKLLGLIALQGGRGAEAIELLRRAVALDPKRVEYPSVLGGALAGMGRTSEAIAALHQALAIDPRYAPAHFNLGNIYSAMGRWEDAARAYGRAAESEPRYAEAHLNLGLSSQRLGRFDEAIESMRRAVAARPDFFHAFNQLGIALMGQGRYAEAAEAFRGALPGGQAEPYNNLGNALQGGRSFEAAVAAYREAIRLKPDYAEAYCNLSHALREAGSLAEAVAAADRAVALQPGLPQGHLAVGLAAMDGGHWDAAAASLRNAIALQPASADAHLFLGNVMAKVGRLDDAVACYRTCVKLDPGFADGHAQLGNVLRDRAEVEEALASYRKAATLSDAAWIGSCIVWALNYHPNYDEGAILQEALNWNARYAAGLTPDNISFPNDRTPGRRLRVGYVSADLRAHAIGAFLLGLMENHDHSVVEVFFYSGVRKPDAVTERFEKTAEVWRKVVGMSDEKLADLIRQDRIDVLVDLTMHLNDSRLLAFARRPAPVQIAYLAHPGTTGLAAMKYRIGETLIDGPDGEACCSEKTLRLSGSYFCYDPMDVGPSVSELPALRTGRVTLGCLNHFAKVNLGTLDLWARVMNALPESRLIVLAPEGESRRRPLERLVADGVGADRVTFVAHRPRRAYMELYHQIDIALDTQPCCGHTTTLDALWMGVPVVTMPGNTVVSRGGLSILSHLGMPDWVAQTPEQYVKVVAELAGDLEKLRQLRASLRASLQNGPLMDGPAFARSFEDAYRTAWSEWRQGK